jgi:preprotein translocase subunit SecA
MILLQVIDSQWKDHLLEMDHLKEGIGLRGYGQRDPLIEYKKESFDMFQSMLDRIEEDAVRYVFLIQPVVEQPVPVRRQAPVYYQQPQGPSGQRAKQARSMIPGRRRKR